MFGNQTAVGREEKRQKAYLDGPYKAIGISRHVGQDGVHFLVCVVPDFHVRTEILEEGQADAVDAKYPSALDLRDGVVEHLGAGECAQWPRSAVVVCVFGISAHEDRLACGGLVIDRPRQVAETVDKSFVRGEHFRVAWLECCVPVSAPIAKHGGKSKRLRTASVARGICIKYVNAR